MFKRGSLVVLFFAVAIVPLGCGNNTDLVEFVTFETGLPQGSTIVATKRESGWAQDSHWYLIFDTNEQGITDFARTYSGGATIDQYRQSRLKLHGASLAGTWMDTVDGMPSWDLTAIKNGRYFRRNDTNGFVSIDLDKNRVYVFR